MDLIGSLFYIDPAYNLCRMGEDDGERGRLSVVVATVMLNREI